ncbi:Regulator of G-protein signaling 22 [Bulinus truncatus]|nr:Regulator of G-protein signaling 22 [Bulinus truncatus]
MERARRKAIRAAYARLKANKEQNQNDKQSEELGVDPTALAAISQAELTLRLSTEQAMISSWDKKTKRKDYADALPNATGRAPPTREHKNEFLTTLNQSAMGHLSIPMLYFYKYLLKHGPEDDMPHIDKDLFFYIEVQKFKDCSHNYSDEELLRGKVQSIVDCFLESCYSPSLQIDIPMDLHQKALKAAQRYVGSKEITSTLFDEAQIYIFKELLLYWAGFRRASSRLADLAKGQY